MRHVLALFDAPVPAARAVRALAEKGFAADDVQLCARGEVPDIGARTSRDLPHEPRALQAALQDRGLGEDDAALCAEGVARRGAILVLVRCPTLSAPVAERLLAAALPPELAEHAARWKAQPSAAYMWAQVAAPPIG